MMTGQRFEARRLRVRDVGDVMLNVAVVWVIAPDFWVLAVPMQ